jgi:hypothetical protein
MCSKMAFPRQLAHMPARDASEPAPPTHMPHRKARQHAPRARWRPAVRARAAPAAPRGPTAGTSSGRPRRAEGAHLALRCAAAPRAGALSPPSGSRRGRALRRPRPRAGGGGRARGAGAAALQNGRGHGPQCLAAAPSRAAARRFNRSRAHIPGTGHNSRGSRPRLFFSASFGTTVIFFYPVTALSPLFACGAWSSHRGHSLAGLRLAFRCEPDLGPVLSAVLAHPVREVLPAAGGFQIRRSTRSVALPATARSPACAAARASLRRRTGLPGICGTAGLRRVRAVPSADCNELFNAGCRMETPQQGRPSKSAVTDFSRRSVAPRSQEPGLAHRCAGVDKECALVVPDRRTRLRVRLPTGRETLLSMLHARAGDAKLSSPRAVLCACTRVRAGRETRRSRPPTDHPQSLVIVASKSRSLL